MKNNPLNNFAHWFSAPVKISAIKLINGLRRIGEPKLRDTGLRPDYKKLKAQYDSLRDAINSQIWESDGRHFYILRSWEKRRPGPFGSGHQALRTGSLLWADPFCSVSDSLESFIGNDLNFYRGIEYFEPLRHNMDPCQPGTPISIAFAIASIRKNQGYLSAGIREKFPLAVDKLIESDFEMLDCSIRPRLTATGFDAIFSLSILSAAYQLRNSDKYLTKILEIYRSYKSLFCDPLTYLKNRNYYLEHIALTGLWTIVHCCPDTAIVSAARESIRNIWRISRAWTNPYFTALAWQCHAISSHDIGIVLASHWQANAMDICQDSGMTMTMALPIDWTNQRDPEFAFDVINQGQPIPTDPLPDQIVFLNGLTLSQSLLLLGCP